MTFNITSFVDRIREVFSPTVRQNRTVEPDATINIIATERIKRSPGHDNLSKICEEPEWYHD